MNKQLELIPVPPLKRAFDIIASIIVIVVLSPLILAILILFALERTVSPASRGPLLYTETRISQGKPFTFYKFRTFKNSSLAHARSNGTIHTKELEQDWRNMTFTGLILRQVYLDEFPQLFLVLTGKMSMVGPRPTNPEEYERGLTGGIRAKTLLRAGLTGRFQTHKSKKYGLSQETVDMEYAEFCRNNPGWRIVLNDMVIVLQTVITIIRAEGI